MADQFDGEPDDELKPDLKFVGGRFNGNGFPLDGLPELAKYQKLITEMAKQLWHSSHPGFPLPDNFADGVRLRLVDVKPGSQKTYFALDPIPAFFNAPTLRDQSQDEVYRIFSEIIASNYGSLRSADAGVVTAFRVMGSTFTGDEMIELRPERPGALRFGLDEHKALVAGLRELRDERTGTLVGTIQSLDMDNKFTLLDAQGRTVNAKFSDSDVWEALHTLHNQRAAADWIWIECDYKINENDGTVVRIDEVREANLFGKSSDPWAQRLAGFASLPEGHADGEGEHTEVHALLAALQILDAISEAGWEEPAIFPSLEGGVRMEWLRDQEHTVLTVDNDVSFYGFHLNGETDEEVIEEPVGPTAALAFVERFIQ